MSANIIDFVKDTVNKLHDFNPENIDCIKEVVREAIGFYALNSYEEMEETESGPIRFIYIHSMMEENLLSKVVEVATENEGDMDIEAAYEGHVIREY